MKFDDTSNANYFSLIKRYLLSITGSLLVVTCVWLGVFFGSGYTANAANLSNYSHLIASDTPTVSDVQEKVKTDIDTVAGEGTSDQLEGQTKEALGTAERNLGQVSGQVKGAIKQAEGKAQKDIGKTKEAIEDLTSQTEETTESALDKIKSFFGN
ncbi:MAG: CsbD family protein [Nostocaceae cyanobacterium]|nr:CsbD family protein [Nostocaceae cyanobacterium]